VQSSFFDELDQKIDNPNRVCEATPNELVTEGGELKFIEKIIEDSLIFKERIIWYTSLIGRKVTLKKVLQILHNHKIKNIRKTSFFQGFTTRWGIAWSFSDIGLSELIDEKRKESLCGNTEFFKTYKHQSSIVLVDTILGKLKEKDIKSKYDQSTGTITSNIYDSSPWYKSISNPNNTNNEENNTNYHIIIPNLILSFAIQIFVHNNNEHIVSLKLLKGDTKILYEIYSQVICTLDKQ